MRLFISLAILCVSCVSVTAGPSPPGSSSWPQFRGPGGSGNAPSGGPLPVEFGPAKGMLWKTELPSGVSSPCIWGDRIFLTGYTANSRLLETLCLDRRTGRVLWRRAAPVKELEPTHPMGSPAVATPVVDGERVYVFFGSYGLLCYDLFGKERWRAPLPLPQTTFGTGTSPVLAGDRLLLSCDYLPVHRLMAFDRRTGRKLWEKPYFPTGTSYATPLVWSHHGVSEVVIHGETRVVAYDLRDGRERWWIGVRSGGQSTPIVGQGLLFVSTWTPGGEAEDRVALPSFDDFIQQRDQNGDRKLNMAEIPRDLVIFRRAEAPGIPGAMFTLLDVFGLVDESKDGAVDQKEWDGMRAYFHAEHGLLAIKPGGSGNVSATHVAWKEKRGLPEVASPLSYLRQVYLVRDGGIVSCLDASSGKLRYRERLAARGPYFASPIAGDHKVYAASRSGVISVLKAGSVFQVLAENPLGEPIMATPALLDGKIYVRTERHLYAFGR